MISAYGSADTSASILGRMIPRPNGGMQLACGRDFLYTPLTRCGNIKGKLFIYIEHMAKKFPLSPLGDRVVVRPDEKAGEKKLASGIIIPETVGKEKPMKGEVMAVGPGERREDGKHTPVGVKVGDQVLFKKQWDEPIKMNDVEYYVLSESDILGIAN